MVLLYVLNVSSMYSFL